MNDYETERKKFMKMAKKIRKEFTEMRRKNRKRISMNVRRICAMTVVCTLLSVLFIQPMFRMDCVQAASYVAAGEYDGIGADTIGNCVAFARYKVPSLPGGLYTLQDKKNIINSHTPMAGAIAITSGNSSAGHVAYVESVSGANVVTLNGGFSGSGLTGHIVRITGTESEQGILGYWYPAGLSAGNNPSGSASYSNIAVEFVDNWNAGLYGRIENPGGSVVSGVGVHIWDSAGNLVVDYTEGCGLQTSYVEQRLNIVAEALPGGLRSGETYTFEMFAGINGTNVMSPKGSFTCTDLEKPVITDAKVYNVGQNGYMVSCKVTDNFKIDRVQFPTWTLADDQDDLPGDWQINPLFQGTQDGDTYTFYVKCSEHNNEYGIYRTHIYAWDKAGNCTSIAVDDVTVEEDNEDPIMEKAEIKEITDDQLIAHVEASDNKQIQSIKWKCLHTYKEMGTMGPFISDLSPGLDKIIYPEAKTFSGDLVIDLSEYQKISDYHVFDIIVTDTSGNTIVVPVPFYLPGTNIAEVELQVGESINTDKLYEQLGIAEKGAWRCASDQDESILKKQKNNDDSILFTAVKPGVEYIYFSQLLSGEGRGCKITVVGDSAEEETPQPTISPSETSTPEPDDFVPEESSKPSSATNTPKPSYQGTNPQKTPTPTISPVVENAPPAITVPKVQGLSVKNQKGRKVKCSWKGVSGTIYYSVQFASNRSFTKDSKGLKVPGTKHTRYSLKKKKTYYVRVRAWRYVTGRGYVAGEWSAVKKVKIKK